MPHPRLQSIAPAAVPVACTSGQQKSIQQATGEGIAMGTWRGLRGFTLVELLVVIALLTLLAGLLLPALAYARDRARQATCLSQLRQIANAQILYLQDWDEQFPHWWQKASTETAPSGNHVFWTEMLQPYVRSEALYHDPSAASLAPPIPGDWVADYALLSWGPGGVGSPASPFWRWAGPPMSLAEVVRPSETFGVLDGWTTTREIATLLVRHSEGMNGVFLDGHARWVTLDQAYEVIQDGDGVCWYRYISADR
jgi:prepilin-type N-terminal cleavage/methylation domain-containing protein/prepilin-type processing-associated H-X9-DG protein